MPGATLGVDVETYRNFFYIGVKRFEDGRRVGYEFSERADFDRDRVRYFLRRNTIITFNGKSYDLPIIYLALSGASNDELKYASDRIIKGRIPWWQVEKELDVYIPEIDHIDLFEPNPAVRKGLKALNGSMHGQRLQDLPYDPDETLTFEQMDIVADYCLHSDLDATEKLYHTIKEDLDLRARLSDQYGVDLRSKSDAQVGETIVKLKAQEALGRRIERANPKTGTTFSYNVPVWMRFETPYMQQVLKTISETKFEIDHDGKVAFPKEFADFDITFNESSYTLGIGGLHSKETSRAVVSDATHVLIDADVASQYPSIIMKLGLYPEALGPTFLKIYGGIIADRLAAKQRAKEVGRLIEADTGDIAALKAEKDALMVRDKGGKIQLNGVYGKLGSAYSVLYAPHLMIAVTLTGQLSLLMLIERAHLAGIPVVSGNTDGVVFRCPRQHYQGIDRDRLVGGKLKEIADWWEDVTSFKLEFAEYKAMYNQSVNTYVAVKANGKPKRKGPIANHWIEGSPDYDPSREGLKKAPRMTVCADAALEHILNGTPVEKFIREYDDVRGFVTVINATGGATWRDGYLGKVVRYYWSTDGDPMIKVKPNAKGTRPKVPKTDGCRPMMNLPDALPDDIDYGRYIDEANQILQDIGFTGHTPSPVTGSPLEALLWRVITFN